MRYFHGFVFSIALALMAQTASASLELDFAGFADNYDGNSNNGSVNNERGWGFGQTLTSGTGNGLGWQGPDTTLYAWNSTLVGVLTGTLTTTAGATANGFMAGAATATPNSVGPYAYTDKWSGGPGGLGVTQELDGSLQADPSSDDNVSGAAGSHREVVGFSLSQAVTLEGLTFRNKDHDPLDGTIEIDYTTDGGANWARDTVANLTNFTQSINANSIVAFGFVPGQGGPDGEDGQFYLGAVQYIPEAGSGLVWLGLMLTAGGLRRHRRTKA